MTQHLVRLVDRVSPQVALAALIVVATLLRAGLAPGHAYLPGGGTDEHFWVAWMAQMHEHGILNVFDVRTYGTQPNYVGYQWVLWPLTGIYSLMGDSYSSEGTALHLLVKVPSICFDAGLIAAVYGATRLLLRGESAADGEGPGDEARRHRLALLASGVAAAHPVILYDGAVWSQTDSAVSLAMLLSLVLAARGRPGWCWAVWALGFAIKPQPVLLAPLLFFVTIQVSGARGLVRGGLSAAMTLSAVIAPWVLYGEGGSVTKAYVALMASDYGRLSVSAWNPWWFVDRVTHVTPADPIVGGVAFISYRLLGALLFACATALSVGYIWAKTDLRRMLIAASYSSFAFYMLPVSTHERYLFPFVVMLLPIAITERRWLWFYVPASATLFINIFVIGPPVQSWSGSWVEAPFIPFVAALNLVMFAVFTGTIASGARASVPAIHAVLRGSFPFSRIRRIAPAGAVGAATTWRDLDAAGRQVE